MAADISPAFRSRDAALVEAGFDTRIGSQTTVGLACTRQLAESFQDHSVKADLRIRF